MLYSDLNEKEIQKRGDVCIHIADSLCCTAETNIVKKPHSNKKIQKNIGKICKGLILCFIR